MQYKKKKKMLSYGKEEDEKERLNRIIQKEVEWYSPERG